MREDLDPGRDPLAWNLAVGRIVRAAEGELARRRGTGGLLFEQWARPLLAAAASLMLLAAGGLLWSVVRGDGVRTALDSAPAFEDAVFPPVVAQWIGGEQQPTVEELVFASSEE